MTDQRSPEPGTWTPCTFVPVSTTCRFCWTPIPRTRPAAAPGPVRAYYNATLDDWECPGCRLEANRVAAWRRAAAEGGCTAVQARVLPEGDTKGTGDLGAAQLTAPESGLTRDTKSPEAA